MAPMTRSKAPKTKEGRELGFVLRTLQKSISNTRSKIDALRTPGKTKVTKSLSSTTKARLSDQKHLQRVVERLSIIEEEEKVSIPPTIKDEKDGSTSTLRPPRIDLSIDSFELGRRLGSGNFGHVHLARHRTTSYICALKIISKKECVKGGQEDLVRRELEVHQNLAHANILRMFAWFHDDNDVYLVLEYAPNGSLFSLLKRQINKRFDEPTTAIYISQMAQALRYIHSKHIIHRDLKPENILLGFHNEIKLADFGWSVHSVSNLRSTVCGTLDYIAPEVAIMMVKPGKTQKWYTDAIDQWSLGILTYELLVGRTPFEMESLEATKKKIANFKGKVKFPGHISKQAEHFVLQLLNLDADKRMGLDEVLQHPWIVSHITRSAKTGLRSFDHLIEVVTNAWTRKEHVGILGRDRAK